MFSATSYFWPILIGLVLFGGLALLAVVVVGFMATRRSSTTPSPTAGGAVASTTPLVQQRLAAVLAQPDLHAADKVVLEGVAAKLEPGPVTREGQEAQLRAMLTEAKETPA